MIIVASEPSDACFNVSPCVGALVARPSIPLQCATSWAVRLGCSSGLLLGLILHDFVSVACVIRYLKNMWAGHFSPLILWVHWGDKHVYMGLDENSPNSWQHRTPTLSPPSGGLYVWLVRLVLSGDFCRCCCSQFWLEQSCLLPHVQLAMCVLLVYFL